MRKVAVVGAGAWGRNLVRNHYLLGSLQTVCDTDPMALSGVLNAHPGIETACTYDEVLEDARISAVVIATPTALHFDFAERALRAGKDVYVEKPLALSADHARRLAEEAQHRGLVLMVGHLLHYHPAFLRLREIAHEGGLGRILGIRSRRLGSAGALREEDPLWDLASHDVSMCLSLVGSNPVEISAAGREGGAPDAVDLSLSFAGVSARISVSCRHPRRERIFTVIGEEKIGIFDDDQPWERKLALHAVSGASGFSNEGLGEGAPEYLSLDPLEPLLAECRHFLECLETRAVPATDGEEACRVLDVLERAQAGLREGAALLEEGAHA
jgi:UDP-2-acetamido-3-amino-2,3-dideoxy-glucuronate N-acetyltransferase